MLEELRDDWVAHRILRRSGRAHRGDGDDPGPEHLERFVNLTEGGHCCTQCIPGLRRGDESRIQGSPRSRRRGTQCPTRREVHPRLGYVLCVCECRTGDEKRG